MVWLLAAGWMLLIAVSLRQSWHLLQRGELEMATEEASDNLAKDKAFRSWATLHGGVYVPVTPQTPPNPLLAGLPEVDVYIRKHTGTEFTHGLCPDCIKKYFPGLEEP